MGEDGPTSSETHTPASSAEANPAEASEGMENEQDAQAEQKSSAGDDFCSAWASCSISMPSLASAGFASAALAGVWVSEEVGPSSPMLTSCFNSLDAEG